MRKSLLMLQLLFLHSIITIFSDQYASYDWEKFTVNKCTLTADTYEYDPNESDKYEMNCTVKCNKNDRATWQPWIYTANLNDTSRSFIFFDDQYDTGYEETEIDVRTWLVLKNFSSGYYRCQFEITSNAHQYSMHHDFHWTKINSSAEMGDECEQASDCLALNAQCEIGYKIETSTAQTTNSFDTSLLTSYVNNETTTKNNFITTTSTTKSPISPTTTTPTPTKICKCQGYFNIPYSINRNNIACLQHVSCNENCNTNAQCFVNGEDYACVDNVCHCKGTWCYVQDLSRSLKCLAPTKINERCVYNEQCYLWDKNSFCNVTCQCTSEYKVDVTNTYCAGTMLNITKTGCLPEDFQDNGKCSLSCTVNTANTDYKLISHSFIYYSADPAVNITMFEAVYVDDATNHHYQAILPLTNYSSGYYECELYFEDIGDGTANMQTATFKIAYQEGVSLHSPCKQASECVTLNAQCDYSEASGSNKTCNCNGYYGITYDDNSYSPACLQSVGAGGNCNLATQCDQPNQNFTCNDFVCTCIGEFVQVTENHNQTMCIIGIALFEPCNYNEQCSMQTNDSFCNRGRCNCQNGYEFNATTNFCYVVVVEYSPGLNTGTIVGIILGVAVSIAVIVAVILKRHVVITFSCSDGISIVFNPKFDQETANIIDTFITQFLQKMLGKSKEIEQYQIEQPDSTLNADGGESIFKWPTENIELVWLVEYQNEKCHLYDLNYLRTHCTCICHNKELLNSLCLNDKTNADCKINVARVGDSDS